MKIEYVALAAGLGLMVTPATAAEHSLALPYLNPSLKAWLKTDLGPADPAAEAREPTRTVSAVIPLSNTKTEILVHLTGAKACNTLLCNTLLILEFNGRTYTKIGESTALLPIRVINGTYGDHPDLIVMTSGDRAWSPFAVRLHFASDHYTEMPGKPKDSAGVLLIGEDDPGERVYP